MAHPRRTCSPRARGVKQYAKPPLSLDELVERLAGRGLQIPDHDRAARYLRHIGYYRLSPYTIPFQQTQSHGFRSGVTFDQVLALYMFDRDRRLLATAALERVEIAVRAALTDHMSTTYKDPHWYTAPQHFKSKQTHTQLLTAVRETIDHQLQRPAEKTDNLGLHHRSALEHYLTTYESPKLLPSWLMVETLTLGQLARVYQNLRNRKDQTAIAHTIGLQTPLLISWLNTYIRVRNICAHHGRLWNVGLGVLPALPKSKSIPWPRQSMGPAAKKRLYAVLASFQTILKTVSPHSTWTRRLHDLISPHPAMYRRGMGVPETWGDDPFWSQHLG